MESLIPKIFQSLIKIRLLNRRNQYVKSLKNSENDKYVISRIDFNGGR